MSAYQRLIELLPSLYRPELDDKSLLTMYLKSVSYGLNAVNVELQEVMQSHWYRFADRADLNRFMLLQRQTQGLGNLNRKNESDRDIINSFPHIDDLARLGALLSLPPWREPADHRESVEEYRLRIYRMLQIYQNGLGTIEAMRAMVEAELAPDLTLPQQQWDRPFSIEQFAAVKTRFSAFETRGNPPSVVGPLMRWQFENIGTQACVPTLYIQGQSPDAGKIDATANPVLERYSVDPATPSIGIAYQGTVNPGETLRIQGSSQIWLLGETILNATKNPQQDSHTSVLAESDWQSIVGGPTGIAKQIYQSYDGMLWLALDNESSWELWRYDGENWLRILDSEELPVINDLWGNGNNLYLATDDGVHRVHLYPQVSDDYNLELVGYAGIRINRIFKSGDGKIWLGNEENVRCLDENWSETAVFLAGADIRCIAEDNAGALYFGADLGLFQYQAGLNQWYWLEAKEESDQFSDWQKLEQMPAAIDSYVPAINDLHIAEDKSIWLATEHGLVRWLAHRVRGLTFKTRLESYADIVADEVYRIRKDPRGLLWFASARGIFKYNGRDLLHYDNAAAEDTLPWQNLGQASLFYIENEVPQDRSAWRYNRTLAEPKWQRYISKNSKWDDFTTEQSSTVQESIRDLIWVSGVSAQIGNLDQESGEFSILSDVNPQDLVVRVKPSDDRIVNGGIAAIPLLPKGLSTWRYLSMEQGEAIVSTERPHWTKEGRIVLPPEQIAPYPGRMAEYILPPENKKFDQQVFAYNPAAKVWLEWRPYQAFAVLVRISRRFKNEAIHPAIIDRIWQGIERVRPAGVEVQLAVENSIVKGVEE